jgi:peptidoglycan/xylan/chitin deacetylase (PgdA/CDA1 family)
MGLLHRRRAAVAALLAASGLASAACRHPLWTVELVWKHPPGVVYAVATDAPRVALTVDDGPDAAGTPAILDTLMRHGPHATFFLLGERVAGREALIQRIVAAGNEIGNHGMHDEPTVDLPPEAFERDLLETQQRLAPFGASCWYRPGSGWYDETMLEVLARHGYRVALGSSYPLDAQLPVRGFASWWLRLDAEPGEVMVLHDGAERGPRTAAVLETLLAALARKGLAVVTLSELVATSRDAGRRPGGIGIGCLGPEGRDS